MNENAQPDAGTGGKSWRGRLFPILGLLLVAAITAGIFYFYHTCPDRVEELQRFGYLGAFLVSLTFNATVILPAGNVIILAAIAAVLPSAILVGLAGGLGAAVGETTGYLAGYSGRAIISSEKMYRCVEGWLRRWGSLLIFLFALLPLIFDLAGIAAGVLRFPFWKFFLICWLGRTLLYVGVALAGAWGWEILLLYFS